MSVLLVASSLLTSVSPFMCSPAFEPPAGGINVDSTTIPSTSLTLRDLVSCLTGVVADRCTHGSRASSTRVRR